MFGFIASMFILSFALLFISCFALMFTHKEKTEYRLYFVMDLGVTLLMVASILGLFFLI